ncbi:hypothetical protein ACFSQU_14505 [Massilia sp. GCM10020059]|uniref:Aerotolerance regulator N-terminal domain-containing protein n=1 Tax=Massilia agrisoli TaxID=2892444 RepID=A0ABS8J0J6_9BURK|nr:hypothetical protein [Massilia agrisoli]MCC6072970.1 hypothetical protein [Massilia agrisoli]
MTISPLWMAIPIACLLAVPLLLRMAGLRRKAAAPRKRLAFDEGPETVGSPQQAHLFRLGRLSLDEPGAGRARR